MDQPFQVRQGADAMHRYVWVDLPTGETVEVIHDWADGTVLNLVGCDGETYERLAELPVRELAGEHLD